MKIGIVTEKKIYIILFLSVLTLFALSCRLFGLYPIKIEEIKLDGNRFTVTVEGIEKTVSLAPPDGGDLTGILIQGANVNGGKVVIIQDTNKKYLPEIRYISVNDLSNIRVVLRMVSYSQYNMFIEHEINVDHIRQTRVAWSSLDDLADFIATEHKEEALGMIVYIPDTIQAKVPVDVYKTAFPGIYLVVPVDRRQESTGSAVFITFSDLSTLPSIKQYLLEQNKEVYIANLIGLSSEDIADLQLQAESMSKGEVFENQFGESDLEKAFTQTQTNNLFRYIDSVNIVDQECGSPDLEGKIFAMDPAPGTSILPIDQDITIYRCQSVSNQEVEVANLTFTSDAGKCNFEGDIKPLDVVLVIDVSGSMQGTKVAIAKSAAINFVKKLNSDIARVGLVSFESQPQTLSELTTDYEEIIDIIAGLSAYGGTNIDLGLEEGYSVLNQSGQENARPVILLLSDGHSDTQAAIDAADKIKDENIQILTVGIGDADQGLLSNIASSPRDFIFSTTNQGLREAFDIAALRLLSGGHIVAHDITIKFSIDIDHYALVESMITNKGAVISLGTLEWNFPVIYEGQKISLPVVIRPLTPNGNSYGTMEITYGSCEDGPEVSIGPTQVYSTESATTFWGQESLSAETLKKGSMGGFDSAGYVMDLGESGIYSVLVEGAGSELPPEIFVGNGNEYLYPLYSVKTDENRVNLFYIENPKLYWLYLQSNSLADSGDYAVQILPGEVLDLETIRLDDSSIHDEIEPEENSVFALEGLTENKEITVQVEAENQTPYPAIVSLDGEHSNQLYNLYDVTSEYVFRVMGKGPYRIVFSNSSDEISNYQVRASAGDRLANLKGDLEISQDVVGDVEPNSVDIWKFQGMAGDGIEISAKIENPEEYKRLELFLLGPKGDQIAWGYDELQFEIGPIKLSEDGEYSIALQQYYSGGEDYLSYGLMTEYVELPEPMTDTLTSGQKRTGNIVEGQEDTWTFEASKGQEITLSVNASDPEAYIFLQILDPRNENFISSYTYSGMVNLGPLEIFAGGEYTIIVSGSVSEDSAYALDFTLK